MKNEHYYCCLELNFLRSIPRELRRAKEELPDILRKLRATYKERTHPKVLLIDNLILICFLIVASVFVYTKIVGLYYSEPYFVALFCPLGLIGLALCLRLKMQKSIGQMRDQVGGEEKPVNLEASVGEFIFAAVLLFLFSLNVMG